MSGTSQQELFNRLDAWLGKLVETQRAKVLRTARELNPRVTPEDILNPHDFPELMADSTFNFEDGQLTGLISAQISLRSEYHRFVEEQQRP